MTISEIKEKHLQLVKNLNGVGVRDKVSVGTKRFVFESDYNQMVVEKKEEEWEGHYVLDASWRGAIFNRGGNSEQKEIYKKIYEIMLSYWAAYAEKKGVNGIIVETTQHVYDEIKYFGNMSVEEFRVVKEQIEVNPDEYRGDKVKKGFCGGVLGAKAKNKIDRYMQVESYLENLQKEMKLFKIKDPRQQLSQLYKLPLEFKYVGDEMEVAIDYNQEEEVKIISVTDSDGKKTTLALEEIPLYLKEIETKRAFVNMMEPSMDMYQDVLNEIPNYAFKSREGVKRQLKESFEKMSDEMGNWQALETEFSKLLNKKAESFVHWKDELNGREIEGWKHKTDDYSFYFLLMNKGNVGRYAKEVRVKMHKTAEGNSEIKRYVADFVTNDI